MFPAKKLKIISSWHHKSEIDRLLDISKEMVDEYIWLESFENFIDFLSELFVVLVFNNPNLDVRDFLSYSDKSCE